MLLLCILFYFVVCFYWQIRVDLFLSCCFVALFSFIVYFCVLILFPQKQQKIHTIPSFFTTNTNTQFLYIHDFFLDFFFFFYFYLGRRLFSWLGTLFFLLVSFACAFFFYFFKNFFYLLHQILFITFLIYFFGLLWLTCWYFSKKLYILLITLFISKFTCTCFNI